MPGAGLAHGPPATKKAGGSHHRFSRDIPAFPARWCYGFLRARPGAPGFLATIIRVMREHHREFDISVGMSGPHDFAVRASAVRPRANCARRHRCVHRSPPQRIVTTRTPLCTRRDARINTRFLEKRKQIISPKWLDTEVSIESARKIRVSAQRLSGAFSSLAARNG